MLRVPPRSSSPYRLAHHMRTLPPGHRPGVELFWRKLILEEITGSPDFGSTLRLAAVRPFEVSERLVVDLSCSWFETSLI